MHRQNSRSSSSSRWFGGISRVWVLTQFSTPYPLHLPVHSHTHCHPVANVVCRIISHPSTPDPSRLAFGPSPVNSGDNVSPPYRRHARTCNPPPPMPAHGNAKRLSARRSSQVEHRPRVRPSLYGNWSDPRYPELQHPKSREAAGEIVFGQR